MSPLTGVPKATVFRTTHHEIPYPFAKEVVWPVYIARHDCGWREELNEWHNAFWAADHHVRYDCGRREQMSSGRYALMPDPWEAHYRAQLAAGEPICFCGTPWSRHGTTRYGGYTVTADCMPPDPVGETHLRKGRPEQSSSKDEAWAKARADVVAEAISRGAYIPPENRYKAAYEGGMQEHPTPSHMAFPLRGAYTEAPTTDLGAITTEVGQVGDGPWEGFPLEGHTQGRTRGRGTGRWVWGRARG
jgi:hypothetical protein